MIAFVDDDLADHRALRVGDRVQVHPGGRRAEGDADAVFGRVSHFRDGRIVVRLESGERGAYLWQQLCYAPTQAEIEAHCAAIRREWTERDYVHRCVGAGRWQWELPVVCGLSELGEG